MKKMAFIMAIVILVAGLSTGCAKKEENAEERVKSLTINDIKADPLSFTGEITITGVNAGVYQADPKVFFVVDTDELLTCKNLGCGAYQLPAIYKGDTPMPKIADEVNLTGTWGKYEVEGQSGKQSVDVFMVTKIDVKRNIMNLLNGGN